MDWLTAHRIAGIAAAHLHRDLRLPEGEYVDILPALTSTTLAVMVQPMPRLFGVYLPPSTRRVGGVLLNGGLDEVAIRHTAAHEWGHHVMNHGSCLREDLDPLGDSTPRAWTTEEKQAEAFAAWFLMPIRAVRRALTRLGTDRLRSAADAYQLSLHLGTTFRGTVRHLSHLRMVARDAARGWATIPPTRLRAQLCGDRREVPARVWDLAAAADGTRLHVHVGDRLVIRGAWIGERPDGTTPDGVDVLGPSASPALEAASFQLHVRAPIKIDSLVAVRSAVDGSTWTVTLAPTLTPHRGLLSAGRGQGDHNLERTEARR